MANNSSIEWTESTWNPVTGCSKVSLGCKNCYAERMAQRLKAIGQDNYKNGFRLTLHKKTLKLPLSWKKPQKVFVNSMSDLFHEDVPLDFILSAFNVMQKANWHIFQILTKRSQRLFELNRFICWQPNIWMGVSVESENYKYRIDDLRKTKAHVKFISFEPLLASVGILNLKGIDWVIVGGESGVGARFMDEGWVKEIKEQCVEYNVKFFFKQWGGLNKKKAGRILEGRTWDEMPQLSFAGV